MINEFQFLRQIGLQQQFQDIGSGGVFGDAWSTAKLNIDRQASDFFDDAIRNAPDAITKAQKELAKARWIAAKADEFIQGYGKVGSWIDEDYKNAKASIDKTVYAIVAEKEQALSAIIKGIADTEEDKKRKRAETQERAAQEEKLTEEQAKRDEKKTNLEIYADEKKTDQQIRLKKAETDEQKKIIEAQARAKTLEANAQALAGLTYSDYQQKLAELRSVAAGKQDSNTRIFQAGMILDFYENIIKPTTLKNTGLITEDAFNLLQNARTSLGNDEFLDLTDLPLAIPGNDVLVYKDGNRLHGLELFYNENGDKPGGERFFSKTKTLPRIITDMANLKPDFSINGVGYFTLKLEDGTEVQANEKQIFGQVACGANYYAPAEELIKKRDKDFVNNKTAEWRDTWIGKFLLWLFGDNDAKVLMALDAWMSPQGFIDKALLIFGIYKDSAPQANYFYDSDQVSLNSASTLTNAELEKAGVSITQSLQNEANGEIIITKDEARAIRTAFQNNFDAIIRFGKIKNIEGWEEVTKKVFQLENDSSATIINYTEAVAQKALIDAMGIETISLEVNPNKSKNGLKQTQQTEAITFTAEEIAKIRTAFNNDADYAKRLGAAYGISDWDIIVDTLFSSDVDGGVEYDKLANVDSYNIFVDAKQKLSKAGFVH